MICCIFVYLIVVFNVTDTCIMQNTGNINRIKAVLAEQNKTSKWLAEQMGKDQTTISKWCTNTYQPSLETLVKIAECLNVDVRELIVKTMTR